MPIVISRNQAFDFGGPAVFQEIYPQVAPIEEQVLAFRAAIALANQFRTAHRRTTYLEECRGVMQAWANFIKGSAFSTFVRAANCQ